MKQFKLQLPSWLHARLSSDARMNRRSLGNEIVYRIQGTIDVVCTDVAARILMRYAKRLRASNPPLNSVAAKKAQLYEECARRIQVEMNQTEEDVRRELITLD